MVPPGIKRVSGAALPASLPKDREAGWVGARSRAVQAAGPEFQSQHRLPLAFGAPLRASVFVICNMELMISTSQDNLQIYKVCPAQRRSEICVSAELDTATHKISLRVLFNQSTLTALQFLSRPLLSGGLSRTPCHYCSFFQQISTEH